MHITVEGIKYKVVESLPYCQVGMPAKIVETSSRPHASVNGERIAVKRGGIWTWWTERDRLQARGVCVGQESGQ